jgi:chemotaxis protein CheX
VNVRASSFWGGETLSSSKITDLFNGTLQAITSIIPTPVTTEKPVLLAEAVLQPELGVLIGITGDVSGRLILGAESAVFGKLGESMFGMPIEGEMLISFVGEFGNMIGGNTSAGIYQKGINIDITTPTVIQGQYKLFGFKQALEIGMEFDQVGHMRMTLILDEEK